MSTMKRRLLGCVSAALVIALLAACQPASAPANDLFAEIKARGTLRISTDLNYAPHSSGVQGAQRAADTRCDSTELTAAEVEGFDIDTAVEIAKRLGVEPCFVTPAWDLITAGSWGGRWDVSVGSMTITQDREKALWFSPAYYSYAAQLAARAGAGIQSVADISGKAVCVGSGTTYDTYLNGGDLGFPASQIKVNAPTNVQVVPLNTDSECVQAIKAGRTEFEAFLTASTVVDAAIAEGVGIEKVGGPLYIENLAVALDKKSAKDPKSLLEAITKAVNDMHADGTLSKSSLKWFGADLSVVK
ncbi:L-cystine-binding protein FliY [Thermoflexales bacterium]|nr:L-cystine-binding protein FliY [Thermoflexales bacterium]